MANLIAPHGGYKNLKSFQMALIVYDLTAQFLPRYVQRYTKRWDQMDGAARSGAFNLGEGSQTSGTSKQSELRLVDVNRASLEELKLDYEAFLRQNDLPLWNKNDARILAIRKLAYAPNKSYKTYMSYLDKPEPAANCLLTLINQAGYLLDQQLRALQRDLAEKGDFRERYKEERKRQILGRQDDEKEFLKQFGIEFDENGLVIYGDKNIDKPK